MPSISVLATYGPLAALGYLTILAVYRIFFSRISHIPGPRLAALTYYYQSWYDVYPYQGRFLWKCKELHERYGPVVRVGPDEVHVHRPDAYVEMYGSQKNRRNKSRLWFWVVGTGEFGDPSTFATLPHDLHRMRRSALAPYFSKQVVQRLEPRVREKVQLLKERALQHQQTGEPLELLNAMSGLTADIISQYAQGSSADFLGQPDMGRSITNTLRESVLLHPLGRTFPTLVTAMLRFSNRFSWKGSPPAKFKKYIEFTDSLTLQAIQEAGEPKEAAENSTTIAQAMLRSSNLPPAEKTPERICAESMLLVAAGTETTARTIAVTLYHILANPAVHARLVEDLCTLLPTPSTPLPTVAALEALPYLVAVVSEGLRMSHGVAGRMARTAPEDLHVGEYLIPAGATFSQSTYLIHTNPAVFPDPLRFLPERFLGDEAPKAYKNLHAFGKGPRSCIGMNLAYSEIYLTLAALLTNMKLELFETSIEDATVEREYLVGVMPADSKGIRVTVKTV